MAESRFSLRSRSGADNDTGMQTFQYDAVTVAGSRVKNARMEAASAEAVRRELVDQGFIPIEIKPVNRWNADLATSFGGKKAKMKTAQISAFARQLHQLLRAGISVPRAIASLGEEADNPAIAKMCADIANKVNAGIPLNEALATYPTCFDRVFCSYIAAGERTGSLVAATARLAEVSEKKAQVRTKVKAVTAYPMLVGVVIVVLVIGIMLFLVPRYEKIYQSFGAELPAPTQALVSISKQIVPFKMQTVGKIIPLPWTFRPNPLSPILWVTVIVVGLRIFLKRTAGNVEVGRVVDKVKFKAPVFGKLTKTLVMYRFVSTLAGGLDAGLQSGQAITLAAEASGSRWIEGLAPSMVEQLQAGKPLSTQIAEHPELFPSQLRTMVTTGEASGELAEMLASVGTTLTEEVDALVSSMGAKIEVLLLAVMGVIVGGILIVLYLPILNLGTAIGDSQK